MRLNIVKHSLGIVQRSRLSSTVSHQAQSYFIFKFPCNIFSTRSREMPTASAISCTLTLRSFNHFSIVNHFFCDSLFWVARALFIGPRSNSDVQYFIVDNEGVGPSYTASDSDLISSKKNYLITARYSISSIFVKTQKLLASDGCQTHTERRSWLKIGHPSFERWNYREIILW